jgi:hypothetical protein
MDIYIVQRPSLHVIKYIYHMHVGDVSIASARAFFN